MLALEKTGDTYAWVSVRDTWAKAEKQNKANLFSKVGIGVQSVLFTLRKQDLTLHNAFCWDGKHCFLTDIKEIDRMYYEVMAALIEPIECRYTHVTTTTDDLNNPVLGGETAVVFPGCVVEKYLGARQEQPQAVSEVTLVLVTPKIIELEAGSVVEVSGQEYEVMVGHVLDEYKNEYEITVKRDV